MRGVNNEELMYRELSDHAKRYDNKPNIVYVVDNDQAGKEFLDKHLFNNLITDYKGGDIKYFVSILSKGKEVKDWNDLLKLKKEEHSSRMKDRKYGLKRHIRSYKIKRN